MPEPQNWSPSTYRHLLVAAAAAVLLLATLVASQAAATTFTVNSANDVDDGTCDVTHCSLREAINAANASVGTDTVAFLIPSSDPGFVTSTASWLIQPSSALPTITDSVVIDGYTQPEASPNTNGPGLGLNTVLKIELDGTNAGGPFAHGLVITADSSTIRGLVINRFDGFGIVITDTSATGNLVQGNFIGTDVTGKVDLGNTLVGVGANASNTVIGGITPDAGNLISGNGAAGVQLAGVGWGVTGNVVQGNFIGSDITGTVALANGSFGVSVFDNANTMIGGLTPGAGNVISGNNSSGIHIGGAPETVVQGNFIGTDVTGISDLGNGFHGVRIGTFNVFNTFDNQIGGTAAGAGNTIAFNGGDGVFVEASTGNTILGNSTFANAQLGIDLGTDGVTLNDVGDGDTGPNYLQNFPVLTTVGVISGTISINGTLNSATSTIFRLEFFSNDACDPSSNGEGETFLGFKDLITDRSGNVGFGASFDTTVSVGDYITATATDPGNNTSEFSQCVQAAPGVPPPPSPPPPPPPPPPPLTPTAIPSVSQWGLLGMAVVFGVLVLVGMGLCARSRRRAA